MSSNPKDIPVEFVELNEDYDLRMVAFELDCNDGKGMPLPCHQAAEYFSVVKDDRARAAKMYADNCEKNAFPPSCFNLGKLHLGGKGVEQDDVKAMKLLMKACDGGHFAGCYHVGAILLTEQQLRLDPSSSQMSSPSSGDSDQTEKAPAPPKEPASSSSSSLLSALFSFANTSGSSKGTANPSALNPFYLSDAFDPPISFMERKKYGLRALEKACNAGNNDGCHTLGGHFLSPVKAFIDDGMKRDPKKAEELFLKGCDNDHGPSCYNLAVMYRKGDEGIERDIDKFKMYAKRSKELKM